MGESKGFFINPGSIKPAFKFEDEAKGLKDLEKSTGKDEARSFVSTVDGAFPLLKPYETGEKRSICPPKKLSQTGVKEDSGSGLNMRMGLSGSGLGSGLGLKVSKMSFVTTTGCKAKREETA